MALHAEKAEAARRVGSYGDAVAMFSGVSLRTPGGSAAYADVVYATLSAMMTELLSTARRKERFARFRARQRVMHHMASAVVYGKKFVPDETCARCLSAEGTRQML